MVVERSISKNLFFPVPLGRKPDTVVTVTCLHASLPAVSNVRVYENYIRFSLKYRFLDHSAIICVNSFGVFQVAMYRCDSWTIKKAEH